MSGILCLKWNNHTSTFIKSLDILRTKELYCDATIACQGKYFPVHRFVLTTCSEYFEEIFERTQCKHPFIIVKDVEELQLEALLNYMYKGEVNVLQDRLPGLIRAAEALKVKGLAVSEDSSEEKRPVKDKRKSNASSLTQPKNKRKIDEKLTNPKAPKLLRPESEEDIDDDDDITEIENESSVPSKKDSRDSISKDGIDNLSPHNHKDTDELSFQSITESKDDAIQEEETEEIKVEPTDIFEAVEEEIMTNSVESQSQDNGKEDSLFVSLLSPNNVHSMTEEDLMANDSSSHAMPQCSSWNDDLSNNSDKTHDEMDAMSLKPMVTLEVGSFSGLNLGGDPLSGNPFFDDPTSAASAAFAIFNNPHQCPHCLHRTKTKPELLRHVSYYHSDFRFTCALCHYKCRTNGLLKKHMLKHTEEKPYSCNVCSYKTARKQHLVRHTKLHTGEKPFSCPICAYKASRKDRLREHLRKHRELNNLKFDFSDGQIEIERAEEHRS